MKKEILEIIQKEYQKTPCLIELLKFIESYIGAIEKQRELTTERFKALLEKYNYQKISSFSEYPEYPYVVLFKGVDSWTLCPVIDYEGGVSDVDQEIGTIFEDPELYPDDENEELVSIALTLKSRIVLTWLSSIWFSIGGPRYGIVVKTLENNSASGFIFNDLAWDDLSEYNRFNDRSNPICEYFDIHLSLLDIYQRVKISIYPVYPYQNKWRFFEKDGLIKEFVSYGNETGEKLSTQTIDDLDIKEHQTLLDRLKSELNTSVGYLKDGFVEIIPDEACRAPMYEGAIETKFHSGQHWYKNEMANRLEDSVINSFERKYKIQFPYSFRHYLRLFNGRKYNNINLNFSIGGGRFLKIKEFYDIEELAEYYDGLSDRKADESQCSNDRAHRGWLPIADAEGGTILMIDLDSANVGVQEKGGEIVPFDILFDEFIREPKNY